MKTKRIRRLIRTIVIELLFYAIVVVVYFFLVLRFLQEGLNHLYADNLVMYAFVSLGLIVAQGVFLEIVTSFLLNHLQLGKPD